MSVAGSSPRIGNTKGTKSTSSATPIAAAQVTSNAAILTTTGLVAGAQITATSSVGERIQGVVFCYDASMRMLVLESTCTNCNDAKDFTVLSLANVQLDSVTPPATVQPPTPQRPLNLEQTIHRERKAIASRQKEAAKIGVGVDSQTQAMFDALSRLMPCEWDGRTIVVMEAVRISAPYTTESVTGGNPTQLSRVRTLLQSERERLAKST